ncbi:MAG: ATP-dependent chaperone ClpB, partial [Actinomycetota bacterium]
IDQTEPYDVRKEQVMAVVRQHFRPEFLNRLDAMVMFNPLDKKELERIARLQVDQLQRRLHDRRITLDISDEALQWLVNKGYDPAYGARPLRRLVQTAIGDPLAKEILSGEVHDGDTVSIGTVTDGSHLTVAPQP